MSNTFVRRFEISFYGDTTQHQQNLKNLYKYLLAVYPRDGYVEDGKKCTFKAYIQLDRQIRLSTLERRFPGSTIRRAEAPQADYLKRFSKLGSCVQGGNLSREIYNNQSPHQHTTNRVADSDTNRVADGDANRVADGDANRVADSVANRVADHVVEKTVEGGRRQDCGTFVRRFEISFYGHTQGDKRRLGDLRYKYILVVHPREEYTEDGKNCTLKAYVQLDGYQIRMTTLEKKFSCAIVRRVNGTQADYLERFSMIGDYMQDGTPGREHLDLNQNVDRDTNHDTADTSSTSSDSPLHMVDRFEMAVPGSVDSEIAEIENIGYEYAMAAQFASEEPGHEGTSTTRFYVELDFPLPLGLLWEKFPRATCLEEPGGTTDDYHSIYSQAKFFREKGNPRDPIAPTPSRPLDEEWYRGVKEDAREYFADGDYDSALESDVESDVGTLSSEATEDGATDDGTPRSRTFALTMDGPMMTER